MSCSLFKPVSQVDSSGLYVNSLIRINSPIVKCLGTRTSHLVFLQLDSLGQEIQSYTSPSNRVKPCTWYTGGRSQIWVTVKRIFLLDLVCRHISLPGFQFDLLTDYFIEGTSQILFLQSILNILYIDLNEIFQVILILQALCFFVKGGHFEQHL